MRHPWSRQQPRRNTSASFAAAGKIAPSPVASEQPPPKPVCTTRQRGCSTAERKPRCRRRRRQSCPTSCSWPACHAAVREGTRPRHSLLRRLRHSRPSGPRIDPHRSRHSRTRLQLPRRSRRSRNPAVVLPLARNPIRPVPPPLLSRLCRPRPAARLAAARGLYALSLFGLTSFGRVDGGKTDARRRASSRTERCRIAAPDADARAQCRGAADRRDQRMDLRSAGRRTRPCA